MYCVYLQQYYVRVYILMQSVNSSAANTLNTQLFKYSDALHLGLASYDCSHFTVHYCVVPEVYYQKSITYMYMKCATREHNLVHIIALQEQWI